MDTTPTPTQNFRVYCPMMLIYSVIAIIFVALSIAGVRLPFDTQSFESTFASRLLSALGGILGLVGSVIGMSALKNRSMGLIRLCGVIGVVVVAFYCATMFIGNGHTSPHIITIFGAISIIPGVFGGTAIRLAAKGLDS